MSSTGNLPIVQALYAAFGRRDNAAVRAVMTPDIEWKQMDGFPRGGRYIGPDEIFARVFQGFRDQWQDWQAVVTEYLDAGDDIIAIGYYAGTFSATGRACRSEFAHRYTVRGGRIVRFGQYADTLRVAQAMGLA
ncbi:MAG: nuclear transport factor 2 family protein [Opitutae bacterium]|nr:nuclear transport factor 2 family protein [Opitutae bacterium]